MSVQYTHSNRHHNHRETRVRLPITICKQHNKNPPALYRRGLRPVTQATHRFFILLQYLVPTHRGVGESLVMILIFHIVSNASLLSSRNKCTTPAPCFMSQTTSLAQENNTSSLLYPPTNCTPLGNPSTCIGTDIAGNPVKFACRVRRSSAYIATGS